MTNNWFNLTSNETLEILKTNEKEGLQQEEAEKRKLKYGLNELAAKKKKSTLRKFLEQFKDFMIIVLIISAIISGIIGFKQEGFKGMTDTIIILIVIIVNAIIGVLQENKAEKSLEALQKLSSHVAKVIRNGKLEVIPSRELVPGDVVILETGDYVPADLRIIEAINLKAQESALTGESVPVEKMAAKIDDEKTGIGDRKNMLFSSSLITYGRGKAIVVETGMNTEVGKIANIINSAEEGETPLQEKLNKLGKTLGIVALAICLAIFGIGLLYGKNVVEMFLTAVSLAVAAIPEGLPAVSTIVLAIGVQRMVKKNAIVKKLPAVETLGSATVICSDKTGTLTQNKMTVEKIYYDDKVHDVKKFKRDLGDNDLNRLIYASMLCNDTKITQNDKLTGDPTETALVDLGFKLDYEGKLYGQYPRIKEIPFDSDRKLMTTVHLDNDRYIVYTKGGVDELLARCTRYLLNGEVREDLSFFKEKIKNVNNEMASSALRVLAMAYKVLDHEPTNEEMMFMENDLIYIGMVGMIDPPRLEVKDAVATCKKAGIKTVMITGDHKVTAIAIAKTLGILKNENEAITGAELEEMSQEELEKNVRKYSVYARVSPEHKVRIVKAWQANGEIVAMTGDGVNDAPSLKIADIGCAMGVVGTDVAKEAADVILTDDNFATVVSAVGEGRRIYDNILKAIQFLLSSNIGEIVTLFVAILITPWLSKVFGIDINLIQTLLPIHLLWINLVTDSLPALALAVDPAEADVMERKPLKHKGGVFTKGMTWRVIYQGIMIGLITLAAFILGLSTPGKTPEEKVLIGQTMAFYVLSLSELVHIFNIRNNHKSIFKTNPFNNGKLILAVIISATLMFVILFTSHLREIFSITLLPKDHIFEIILLVFSPLLIVELFKLLKINGKD